VVADKFSTFFVNIGKNLSTTLNHFSSYLKSPIADLMSLLMMDAEEVVDIVSNFQIRREWDMMIFLLVY